MCGAECTAGTAAPTPTTAVDTVATVMTPAARKPVDKTRLAFLPDRPSHLI